MAERTVPLFAQVIAYVVALVAATVAWLLVVAHLRGTTLLVVVLLLAALQAGLVVLCFMDLWVQPASNRLAMVGAVLMVALLVFLVVLDPATRSTFPRAPEPPSADGDPAPPR